MRSLSDALKVKSSTQNEAKPPQVSESVLKPKEERPSIQSLQTSQPKPQQYSKQESQADTQVK